MNGILAVGPGFAVDIALKATLLFSITVLAVMLLERSGAAARHFAGMAGLIGALALPVLVLALPRFEIPVFPSLASSVSRQPLPSEPPPSAVSGLEEKRPVAGAGSATAEPVTGDESSKPAPATRASWLPFALAAWAAGALLVSARLVIGLSRVAGLRRKAAPIRDLDWRQEADRLSERLAVRRPVALYESARVPVAITSGLFRPFLLLCRQARLWAAERRRVVLLHEISHVKRGDWFWLLLAEAALAFYWWHPLAWILTRQVRRDGEKACDDLV